MIMLKGHTCHIELKCQLTKWWALFNRNNYATFISIVFENVYMVKLVRVPWSVSPNPVWPSGRARYEGATKEGTERIMGTEKERDGAKKEA